jgi:hypothetical protein
MFREDRQPGSGNESTSAVSLQFSNGSSDSPLIDWDSLYGSTGSEQVRRLELVWIYSRG